MSTAAQMVANRANSQQSTGPKSESGKAVSCKNNFRYGFNAAFTILGSENEAEFDSFVASLHDEYQPSTITERLLVQKLAQHHWLSQRAIQLQTLSLDDEKQFALFLRYQTTNDRAFSRCLNDLLKLRAEKRKAEIGFESQQRKRNDQSRNKAEQTRRQSNENRKQELHQWAVLLAEAKLDHQQALTSNAKLPQTIAAIKEESRAHVQEAA